MTEICKEPPCNRGMIWKKFVFTRKNLLKLLTRRLLRRGQNKG